mgnify:FL=1|tara:strand:- start:103 stop:951 length:849 start_codon:yes stop_codon:yes gene_type:complete
MAKNYLSIYAKSFNWAGFFLPKIKYKNCSALYDFCRTVDNIVDDDGNLDLKKKNLIEFKKKFFGKDFSSSKIEKMWDLINEFSISTKIIEDLFDGVETDLVEKVKLNSRKDLLIYSYRVAGTVGLMMAKILRVNSERGLNSAIDLGIAMQLTNIARDVIEDKKRNREYIDHNIITIKETLKLADMFYNSSFKSIREIPISCRFAILVARRVYRQIGYEILKKKDLEDYERAGKIFVTNVGKIKQTFLSLFDFIILIFLKPENNSYNLRHEDIKKEINLNERF